MSLSAAERLARRLAQLPEAQREDEIRRVVRTLPVGGERALHAWRFWGRPEQFAPPGAWRWWWVLPGRGFGKTRMGAEWCLERSQHFDALGVRHRGALIGQTAADVRDVMVEGESGLIAACERAGTRHRYVPSKRRFDLPELGSTFTTYSAEKPRQLRGPQHHSVWADEVGAWRHFRDTEGGTALSNADFGLRLRPDPRACVTSTPKPIEAIREAVVRGRAGTHGVVLTEGTMYDNLRNLAPEFVTAVTDRYAGTRLGDQELLGILLDTVEGALWVPDTISDNRVADVPPLERIVVGVDPPAEDAECGIVVVAAGAERHGPQQREGHAYVLEDASMAGTPEEWGAQVVAAFHKWGANQVVAEVNMGGDMVRAVIHAVDSTVPVRKVRAAVGKQPRAEGPAALYSRKRVHHVGTFGMLESQLVTWVPGESSPDRLDALVWGLTDLFPDMTRRPAQASSAARLNERRVDQ